MTAGQRIQQHCRGVVLFRCNTEVVGGFIQRPPFVRVDPYSQMVICGNGGGGIGRVGCVSRVGRI